jgi:hypothetical protein
MKAAKLLTAVMSLLLVLSVVVSATSTLTGCSALHPVQRDNDTDRLSDLEGDYNLALEVILYAGTRGWIPVTTESQIDVVRKTANDALNKLKAEVAAGGKLDQSAYYTTFRDSLTSLLRYQREYETKVNADKQARKLATRPA